MRSIRARHLFSLSLATGLCYYLQHVLQIRSPLQHLLHVRWLLCAMWLLFIQLHPLAKCVVKYALSLGYNHKTVFLIDNAHETYRDPQHHGTSTTTRKSLNGRIRMADGNRDISLTLGEQVFRSW